MKKIVAICSISLQFFSLYAQRTNTDSLKNVINNSASDSAAILAMVQLSAFYSYVDPDTALAYSETAIQKSHSINFAYGEMLALLQKAEALDRIGEYSAALNATYSALRLAEENKEHKESALGKVYRLLGHLNIMNNNDSIGISLLHRSKQYFQNSGEVTEQVSLCYYQIAFGFLKQGRFDSAFYYMRKGAERPDLADWIKNPVPFLISGNIYLYGTDSIEIAKSYFLKGLEKSKELETPFLTSVFYATYGEALLNNKNKRDSSIYYLQQSLAISQKFHYKLFQMNAAGLLSYIYEDINTDSALKYLKIRGDVNSEVYNTTKLKQFELMGYEEDKRQRELALAKYEFQQRNRQYLLGGGLIAFLVIASILWFNNRRKQKMNISLRLQKEKTEKTLEELKSTQVQLIQSEKMASLGSLTAGIAHEIQNPLNFVNNFSEINSELAEEIKTAIAHNNLQEVSELADEIRSNAEKILHHGKRADNIVKSMLQHSRVATGQKELIDINTLADEYLRLAYHGMRARDKMFNADLKTALDPNIGKINIVGQDIGRVLLNLYNNAFYAVGEKKKTDPDFNPVVFVQTKRNGRKVEITVKDNGIGIPEDIQDKIFQPFFTTKPTGQGTGLGLSLSYDIVQAQGGEIKLSSKVGEGTEFTVSLTEGS